MNGNELFAKLSAPFDPKKISWRVGSTNGDKSRGLALCYIDARDVQDRFNEVCGPFGWQSEHTVAPDGKKVTCRIGVKDPDTGTWVWRSDGAGETDYEAEKGSYSDSLKRAAVSFGVGRYLYDLEAPWVSIEPMGRSYKIKDSEQARLAAILSGQKITKAEQRKTDTKTEAAQWARDTEERLANFETVVELTAWETKATPAIVRLKTVDEDAHARLVEKIKQAYDRLDPH